MRPVLIAALGLLGVAAWMLTRPSSAQAAQGAALDWLGGDSVLSNAANSAADFVDYATGGILKISNMRQAQHSMLGESNVRAMLRVIRAGEGTSDKDGYRRLFGGKLFSGYADHPRVTVTRSGYTSTAAGAYQFLSSTWDETKAVMGLPDFSPASQDLAALGRIAARGALDDVRAGRFAQAIAKIGREWASIPGSPYGQPTRTMAQARATYLAAGGRETATA